MPINISIPVPLVHGFVRQQSIRAHKSAHLVPGFIPIGAFHFALHKRAKSGLEQFKCFADTFMVCDRHRSLLLLFYNDSVGINIQT